MNMYYNYAKTENLLHWDCDKNAFGYELKVKVVLLVVF